MWREFYRFDKILLRLLNLAKDYPLKKEIAVIQGLYLKAQIMKIQVKPVVIKNTFDVESHLIFLKNTNQTQV